MVFASQGLGMGRGDLVDDIVESDVLTALRSASLPSEWDYYLVEINPKDTLPTNRHFFDWLLTE